MYSESLQVLRCLFIISLLSFPKLIFAQKQKEIDLLKLYQTGKLIPVNRELKLFSNDSVTYLQVSENKKEGIVWLPLKQFENGTIEIEMRGKDIFQRSFIGIAFHGLNDSVYDAVYCRPFNFFAKDSVRRVHAIQYVSHPDFTWEKLRNERNAVFEKQIIHPPDPNGWFTLKLVINDSIVKAFIDNSEIASLEIKKLNSRQSGKTGFFTGDSSGGDFKSVKLSYYKYNVEAQKGWQNK